VHAAAAMTYTLLVLLAKGRVKGGAGWARALLAAGLMLSPQLGATSILLLSPDRGRHMYRMRRLATTDSAGSAQAAIMPI